jgi:hypothetical protein
VLIGVLCKKNRKTITQSVGLATNRATPPFRFFHVGELDSKRVVERGAAVVVGHGEEQAMVELEFSGYRGGRPPTIERRSRGEWTNDEHKVEAEGYSEKTDHTVIRPIKTCIYISPKRVTSIAIKGL